MSNIYKSSRGEQLVRDSYFEFLKHWPVPNQQLRVPTCEGETFVIASGDEHAPKLLLLHGGAANSAMWIGDIVSWAKHFRVFAVDMIGEAGLSAHSRPLLSLEAHALWLDDVLQSLNIDRASVVGVSLGGWLGVDYATRRPNRVEKLVLLSPGGIGSQKLAIIFKLLPLRLCGNWGARKAREIVLGALPNDPSPEIQRFMRFVTLIHENFIPRLVKIPVFNDEALRRLRMPVMAILGGKDVLLDSAETKRRLELCVPLSEVRYYPDAGHFIPKQTTEILNFLCRP
jgi:pimeloyl-ACP methyl ester carboxylesterase